MLPVDDVHGAAAAEPAVRAHRDPGDHPVPGPGLLDAQIDDDHVGAGEFLEFRVVDAHPGVDHLREGEHLAGPLGETAQDTLPVVSVTEPGSIAVTRSIGTKILPR